MVFNPTVHKLMLNGFNEGFGSCWGSLTNLLQKINEYVYLKSVMKKKKLINIYVNVFFFYKMKNK